MVLSSCRVMCLRGMIAFIPLLLAEQFGYDTAGVGWIMTVYFIFGTGSSIIQGKISDRFQHTTFIVGMMVAGTVAFALIPLSDSVWMLFPVLALLASSLGPSQGPILAVTTETAGEKNYASSVGLLYTMNEVSGMISPFVGGLIAQKVGLQRAFFFFAATALAGTVASVLVHRARGRQLKDEAQA
jgi:MFS family permease